MLNSSFPVSLIYQPLFSKQIPPLAIKQPIHNFSLVYVSIRVSKNTFSLLPVTIKLAFIDSTLVILVNPFSMLFVIQHFSNVVIIVRHEQFGWTKNIVIFPSCFQEKSTRNIKHSPLTIFNPHIKYSLKPLPLQIVNCPLALFVVIVEVSLINLLGIGTVKLTVALLGIIFPHACVDITVFIVIDTRSLFDSCFDFSLVPLMIGKVVVALPFHGIVEPQTRKDISLSEGIDAEPLSLS